MLSNVSRKRITVLKHGLTIDFKIKDTITFKAMSEIAQVMNTIPIDKQHVLHDKKAVNQREYQMHSI